jgi:stress response protein YsnF
MTEGRDDPSATIGLAEEHLSVGKRRGETGRVRVRVSTEIETVNPRISLLDQTVEVERVRIDREVKEVPQIREEGDITIIPILEEVLVVEKRLVLKEEVRVRRVVAQTEATQPVTLRRQRAEVERLTTKQTKE